MEQASGSFMTGIRRAFSAHLPLTSLFLWLSSAISSVLCLLLSGEYRYVSRICWIMSKISTMMMVVPSAPVSIFNLNPTGMYLPLPL